MSSRKLKTLFYIVFVGLFTALLFIYIRVYQTLGTTDKRSDNEKLAISIGYHINKFQVYYNDIRYYEKLLMAHHLPGRLQEYKMACINAAVQIDSLKQLCGKGHIAYDDIGMLDSLLKKSIAYSDKVVAPVVKGRQDTAAVMINAEALDQLRSQILGKTDEILTHAVENNRLFQELVKKDSKKQYELLGLLITETLLFFGFVLWRMGVQLSNKEIKRKDIEKQLQFVNKAIEQSSASMVITNLKGDIEYVNPAFTRLTGYSFNEAIGQNPRLLKTGHTTPEEYAHLWDNLTHNKQWQGEFLNKKKNGETYWEFATISPIINEQGEVTNFVAVKENITERKRLEEEQKQLLTIVENSTAYIFTSDLNMNFIYGNQAIKNILEIGEEDITKYKITAFRSAQAESVTPEVEHILLITGKWTGETTYKTKNGRLVPVIQVFILHKDSTGKPAYVSGTGINISKQKEAEEALQRLNTELRDLSKHLQYVRETEKNKLAKEMHDELGQGLASLKLNVSWIKNHLGDDTAILEKKVDELLLSISAKLAAFNKIYLSANTAMLEEIGLYSSVEYLVDQFRKSHTVQIFFSSNIENEKICSSISLAIYRIVEESLVDSILYANAGIVKLRLFTKNDTLILEMEDNADGYGISNIDNKIHYGTLEMRERVYAMKGRFNRKHITGKGIFTNIQVPLN